MVDLELVQGAVTPEMLTKGNVDAWFKYCQNYVGYVMTVKPLFLHGKILNKYVTAHHVSARTVD